MTVMTRAQAMSSICQELPNISADFKAEDFQKCRNTSEGKTFDFYAFTFCRDLNQLASKGAKASDINSCLVAIADKRFNYKKLRGCKKSRGPAKLVLGCLKSSAV